jgi:hypothetical protein
MKTLDYAPSPRFMPPDRVSSFDIRSAYVSIGLCALVWACLVLGWFVAPGFLVLAPILGLIALVLQLCLLSQVLPDRLNEWRDPLVWAGALGSFAAILCTCLAGLFWLHTAVAMLDFCC